MKLALVSALAFLAVSMQFVCLAQADDNQTNSLDIAADTRFDFASVHADGADKNTNGFYGRYLNVMVNGTITPQLSYSWRQRFNKFQDLGNDVFSATDWIYLNYAFNDNWSVSGGKQVLLVGGFEYDAAPIDIFYASRFWNNIACYQFGASATYTTSDGNHAITAQVSNSPYQPLGASCFAYNLYWAGKMGNFSTLWSVNMAEYERGKYANFIALGNQLAVDDFTLQLDLMNRYAGHHKFIAGDYTVIAKASYAVKPWMTVFAKGGYDEFKPLPGAPEHADNPFYGGGFEFYPLPSRKNQLRIHAVCDRVSDNEGNRYTEFSLGLKWRVNLYSRK